MRQIDTDLLRNMAKSTRATGLKNRRKRFLIDAADNIDEMKQRIKWLEERIANDC